MQVGQRVKKGQLLVILECDDYELRRDQLQADLQFSRYQYQRSRKLLQTKSVSEESHQQLLANLHKLEARLQLLDSKIQLAKKI